MNGNYPIAGWWQTIWSGLQDCIKYILDHPAEVETTLNLLVQFGIITPAEKGGMEGLTAEQVAAMIEARYAATAWERYLPWIIAGGLGIGLVLVLALRK